MKKIFSIFLHPIFLSLVGLLFISLLIWFGGPLIKFGEGNTAPLESPVIRLLVIMVILVAWGLNNLRIQRKENKNNDEFVSGLEKNQSLNDNPNAGVAAEEIEQLNERFTQALSVLKKLKFNKRGKSKALYELPWYIIVGPPGSGKTTALINSSLDFPLAEQFGKGALQGVGGTRNCDWWFTNEAVLIDTAGRYTTQDSHKVVDSSAWEGFLSLLKRNRRRRPINGAIVAISLTDLLTQTEEERNQYSKTIRMRLDELMEKLEIRFPVYLMFTKSDMVSGFGEFFEDLTRDEREQVWGVSLPDAPNPAQAPDFEYLNTELSELVKTLYQRVIWRMQQERDKRRRAAIYGFPQQMENLSSTIDAFIKQTFIQNRYKFQPYLRGVYFTSGTQDGTPIDRLMSAVSSTFGFSREASAGLNERGKSFFIGRLFRDIIFPESELVGVNTRYEAIIRWAKRAAYAGMAGVSLALGLVWAESFNRHSTYMNDVATYIEEYNTQNTTLSEWNLDVRAALPPLNALAKASIVYDQEKHPWLTSIGMYDARIDENANRVYAEKLKTLFLPRLITQLEQSIQRGHQGGDLYNTFRIYMMFKHLDKFDGLLVKQWFENQWGNEYQGEATRRQELISHLEALLALEFESQALNDGLVSLARETLLRVPVSQRIYGRVKADPEYRRKVDILNYFGESVRSTFLVDEAVERHTNIPVMFTIDAYKELDFGENTPVVADVVNERWLLSDDDTKRVDFVKDDFKEISQQAHDHYVSDYINTWSSLYESLDVASFVNIADANNKLLTFVDPVYSPVRAILEVGTANTQITPPIPPVVGDKVEQGRHGKMATFLVSKRETTKIDKAFNDLHTLVNEDARGQAPVNGVIARIKEMQAYITEITLSPDPNKKAFEIVRARYKSGAGNPITTLRAFSKTQPKPVDKWLSSLSDETWKVVLGAAHAHVNSEWGIQVVDVYRRGLAGRYPINGRSSDELAMFDFSEFFKPQGTLDVFYQKYVAPFIDTRGQWKNRIVDNYSMNFSSASLNQVRRGMAIKSILFGRGAAAPEVSLELMPLSMSENDARFILEVGEQRVSYKHGPKFWKSIKWSGADENRRIRVVFEDLDGDAHEALYSGPWSWFRLMDKANIRKTSRSNVYALDFVAEGRTISYEAKVKSVNNPLSKNFISAFKCPEKL